MKRNSVFVKFILALSAIAIAMIWGVGCSPSLNAPDSSAMNNPASSSVSYNPVVSSPDLLANTGCPQISCTRLAFRHIRDRHCESSCQADNKSIFIADYCGSEANMRKFCNAIKNSSNCREISQRNGRIKAVATLNSNVGTNRNNQCNLTKTGSIIYEPRDNIVVTQFPGQ